MKSGKEYTPLRKDYVKGELRMVDTQADPIVQFEQWFREAIEAEDIEANVMSLATSHEGQPSVRIVLLKGFDEKGFVFYTNYLSQKGKELTANPKAGLNFFWPNLERQVRIEGTVEKVSDQESDEYFGSRDRGSRIGAWASPQSQALPDRKALEARIGEVQATYEGQTDIPRPPHWGGFRVQPHRIEFWQGRASRLHDRIAYLRQEDGSWQKERLAP